MIDLVKIKEDEVKKLYQDGLGYYHPNIGLSGSEDCEKYIIQGNAGYFVAPYTAFRELSGRHFPKTELILAIGGLVELAQNKLARQMKIPVQHAEAIICFRRMPQWTEELERKLLDVMKGGILPNVSTFGLTTEQKAQQYWKNCQLIRNIKLDIT